MTMLTRLYDESDKMKSKEEEQPNKKVLFVVIDLIERIALFQNNDIAKQLRKHTAQLNKLLTPSLVSFKKLLNNFVETKM